MNTLKFLTVLLAMALFPFQSLAAGNAGDVTIRTGPDRTSGSCSVREGRDCYFVFGTATPLTTALNSKVFQVDARTAIACRADVGNTSGSVTFWKAVNPIAPVTRANSMVPSDASASTLTVGVTNTNCFTLSTGRWWIEVTTATNSFDSVVVITGSKE